MKWVRKFAGFDAALDDLCRYYQELGIDASILPDDSPEAVELGIMMKGDLGYIRVRGRNFDLVTIRSEGVKERRGCSMSLIPVPLASKTKIGFQCHHIVRPSFVDEIASKARLKKKIGFFSKENVSVTWGEGLATMARLKKKRKGFFSKEIVAVTWKGGSLATTLSADPDIERSLLNFLTTEDDLRVNLDKKNNVVRIVFSRPAEMKAGLLQGFKFDRRLYPKEAIDVIDKIAGLIR